MKENITETAKLLGIGALMVASALMNTLLVSEIINKL